MVIQDAEISSGTVGHTSRARQTKGEHAHSKFPPHIWWAAIILFPPTVPPPFPNLGDSIARRIIQTLIRITTVSQLELLTHAVKDWCQASSASTIIQQGPRLGFSPPHRSPKFIWMNYLGVTPLCSLLLPQSVMPACQQWEMFQFWPSFHKKQESKTDKVLYVEWYDENLSNQHSQYHSQYSQYTGQRSINITQK